MKRTAKNLSILFFLTVSMFAVIPTQIAAADDVPQAVSCDNSNWILGFPTWHKYLEVGPEFAKDRHGNVTTTVISQCAIIGPRAHPGTNDESLDTQAVIGRIGLAIIEILLRIGTLAAVAFVILGGFRYITSQGEPENAKSARQTILNALIGLVISLLATATVAYIGSRLTS